jgi:hypothetical protein
MLAIGKAVRPNQRRRKSCHDLNGDAPLKVIEPLLDRGARRDDSGAGEIKTIAFSQSPSLER